MWRGSTIRSALTRSLEAIVDEGVNMFGNATDNPELEAAKAVIVFARTSFGHDAYGEPEPESLERWSDDIMEQVNKPAS